jgi:hypothetical protein
VLIHLPELRNADQHHVLGRMVATGTLAERVGCSFDQAATLAIENRPKSARL